MSFEEKRAWTFLVAVIATTSAYLLVVAGRASGIAWQDVAYAGPMFASMAASVGVAVVGAIVTILLNPEDGDAHDERDVAINRHGDVVGYVVLSVGVVGALVLTVLQKPHFFIGNAIFLACALSAVVSTVVKLISYRRGFPW
jgi:hypothetical protein